MSNLTVSMIAEEMFWKNIKEALLSFLSDESFVNKIVDSIKCKCPLPHKPMELVPPKGHDSLLIKVLNDNKGAKTFICKMLETYLEYKRDIVINTDPLRLSEATDCVETLCDTISSVVCIITRTGYFDTEALLDTGKALLLLNDYFNYLIGKEDQNLEELEKENSNG